MDRIKAFAKPFSEDRLGEFGSGANPEKFEAQDGMDLRDYFAATAMRAIMGNKDFCKMVVDQSLDSKTPFNVGLAIESYNMADAMINYRKE